MQSTRPTVRFRRMPGGWVWCAYQNQERGYGSCGRTHAHALMLLKEHLATQGLRIGDPM